MHQLSVLLAAALLLAGAALGGAAPVTITPDGDGFAVTTDVYSAKVDGRGALSSLVIAGQEFIAPPTKVVYGDQGGTATGVYASPLNNGFFIFAPLPGAPTVRDTTVSSEGHGWQLAYTFGPDTIDITYSGTPEGTRGFRAGYPMTELDLSLAHDLSRCCDPDNQGELGWPVNRPMEPGNFTVLAKNGAGFTAQDVARMAAWTAPPNLPAEPHRLDSMIFYTFDTTDKPLTHRLTCFTRADLAHSLTMEITSPNQGHLFSAPEKVVFPVKVTALYGHTLSGSLTFDGAPYVWKKPPLTAAVPLTLTADQPTAAVELPLYPQKPGHYTGKIGVVADGKPIYSQRVGFVYRPEQIPPAQPPADFDQFWADTMAELDKVPLDLTLEEQTDKETAAGKVYKAKYRSWGGKWAWAWLYVPKGDKQVDGYLRLPPVSVWQPGQATKADGSLTIAVAIHGGDIGDYPAKPEGGFDYMNTGITSRETYALRYAYCCVARCYDILKARPECNGIIHARGGSQGAGLLFVAAGLRPVTDAAGAAIALVRIDWTVLGYAQWGPGCPPGEDPQKIAQVVEYFDPANFAHRIHSPMRLAMGLFDFCAPAEGIFTAINALPADTKCEVFVDPFGGHFTLNAPGFNSGEPGVQIPRWRGTAEENKLVR